MHVPSFYIPMWIVVVVVIGGLAGLLASVVVRGTGLGILADIVIGILGAVVGGFLFTQFGHPGVTGLNLYSLLVAFVGAVILLLLAKAVAGGSYGRRGRAP
jgi:uncharacterized membrane protein YeaQ/YmgE (transglycosylase-associated protein family)